MKKKNKNVNSVFNVLLRCSWKVIYLNQVFLMFLFNLFNYDVYFNSNDINILYLKLKYFYVYQKVLLYVNKE